MILQMSSLTLMKSVEFHFSPQRFARALDLLLKFFVDYL